MRNFTKSWLVFGKSYQQQQCNSWEELADHHASLHSASGLTECVVTSVCVSHCAFQRGSPQTFGNSFPYYKWLSFHFSFVECLGCHIDEKENTHVDRLYYLWASRYLERHYKKYSLEQVEQGRWAQGMRLCPHCALKHSSPNPRPRAEVHKCKYFHLLKRDSFILTLSRELLGVLGAPEMEKVRAPDSVGLPLENKDL